MGTRVAGSGPPGPGNPALPKKEYDLFKSIAKLHDSKQYKKGLKAADTVLRKFPTHGECHAYRALVLNGLLKKTEAYDACKLGLRNDMRSPVCWHAYGLLYRSDHKYADAIKSYKQALRLDEQNLQILRDMSLLQIQVRDLDGFYNTRNRLLDLKPHNVTHWTAFAVASFVTGRPKRSVKVINAYLKANTPEGNDPGEPVYDESELLLFKVGVLRKTGDDAGALEALDKHEPRILDKLGAKIARAELLLLSGDHAAAAAAFKALIHDENAETFSFHRGYHAALLELNREESADVLALKAWALPAGTLPLPAARLEKLAETLGPMAEALPKMHTPRWCYLATLAAHPEVCASKLRAPLDAYLRANLRKGVPALGAQLMALYVVETASGTRDPRTGVPVLMRLATDALEVRAHPVNALLEDLVRGYVASLAATEAFPAAAAAAGSDAAAEAPAQEPPTTLLWCLYLQAQLAEQRGAFEEALPLLEKCFGHTPTMIDILERKARVLKKSGDSHAAAESMEAARTLDLQDRYINNKAVKYLFRDCRVDQARGTASLFTADNGGDVDYNLSEMEASWYYLENARSHHQSHVLEMALKKYGKVEDIHNQYLEDQFDYHMYCMRKMTLRAYTNLLSMEDELLSRKPYQKGMKGAVQCWLALAEKAEAAAGAGGADGAADGKGTSAAERKREKLKARKAKKKAETAAADRAAASAKATADAAAKAAGGAGAGAGAGADGDGQGTDGDSDTPLAKQKSKPKPRPKRDIPADEDPEGFKAVAEKAPLDEALRLVRSLLSFVPGDVASLRLTSDVAHKRGRPLLALQAAAHALRLTPNDATALADAVAIAAQHAAGTLRWASAGEDGRAPPAAAAALTAALEGMGLGDAGKILARAEAAVTAAQGGHLDDRLGAALALAAAAPKRTDEAFATVLPDGAAGLAKLRGVTVDACAVVEKKLPAGGVKTGFRKAAAEYFPRAKAFA